jgi:hypothetical protein
VRKAGSWVAMKVEGAGRQHSVAVARAAAAALAAAADSATVLVAVEVVARKERQGEVCWEVCGVGTWVVGLEVCPEAGSVEAAGWVMVVAAAGSAQSGPVAVGRRERQMAAAMVEATAAGSAAGSAAESEAELVAVVDLEAVAGIAV